MSKYIIEQHTGYQYEPIPDGEFDSQEAAINGMRELESECGFRDMRVVKDDGPRYNLSGRMLIGDDAHEVIEYGLDSDSDDE
ncbi:hypothetical protein GB989_04850 [Shigella sonnei]|nr:hypothetical protein [Shigella sonnei]